MKNKKTTTQKIITAPDGGSREPCGARWDWIPFNALRWVARVFHYGGLKYEPDNWKGMDFDSEQSPLSHGIGHAFEAAEWPRGSIERKWLLAKAAWNLLAEIWYEETYWPTTEEAYRQFADGLLEGGTELG